MAKGICIVSCILLQLIYAALGRPAALPASPLEAKTTVLQLSDGTSTLIKSSAIRCIEPYYNRNIILRPCLFGQPIPEIEVKTTLLGAQSIVNEFEDHHADELLANDRFEYQRPGGSMLIVIDAQAFQQITWRKLFQVLQALQGFMTTTRPYPKIYHHSMTFGIELSDRPGVLGNGLVWFLPSGSDQVQRRAIGVAADPDTNRILLQSVVAANICLDASADKDIVYRVSRQSLAPVIYHPKGLSSMDEVVVATRRPMVQSTSRATMLKKDETAPSDRSRWMELNASGPRIRVAITILLPDRHELSWQQFYDVLYGLFDSHGLNGIVQFSKFRDSARIAPGPVKALLAWLVLGTDNEFKVTISGNITIPQIISSLLRVVQVKSAAAVRAEPIHGIRDDYFPYVLRESGRVVYISAYKDESMTWLDPGLIVIELPAFRFHDHTRGEVFEIDIHGYMYLMGTIQPSLNPVGASAEAKRALISTNPFLSPTTTSVCTSYPIPDTPMTLHISPLGHTDISLAEISATLTGALGKINPHLGHEGDHAIPGNRWSYGEVVTDIWLEVVVWIGRTLSWQQLDWVVSGLLQWVSGLGRSNIKAINFDFDLEGEGFLGIGALWIRDLPMHSANETARVMPNELSRSPASSLERRLNLTKKTVPPPLRTSITSALHKKDEPLPASWSVPGSQLALQLTYRRVEGPDFGLNATETINSARATIQTLVRQYPGERLISGSFLHQLNLTSSPHKVCVMVHESSGHIITWTQLDNILAALSLLIQGVTTESAVDIDIVHTTIGKIGFGTIACGHVQGGQHFTDTERRTPLFNGNLTRNVVRNVNHQQADPPKASSSSPATNRPITLRTNNATAIGDRLAPFRIPNTPIILEFNTLPIPIPADRVADLWTEAQNAIATDVVLHPYDSITPSSFFYEVGYSGNREIIAFAMSPEPYHELTWLQLQQIMLGVQIVMTGRGTASHMLALEIAVTFLDSGRVANGLLRYIKHETITSDAADKQLS